jgi:hypothetical protein
MLADGAEVGREVSRVILPPQSRCSVLLQDSLISPMGGIDAQLKDAIGPMLSSGTDATSSSFRSP